jgi:hypothetical protein
MHVGFIFLGKVDDVPGLFSVKTRFLMIGVPLVPMGSYLVKVNEEGADGEAIPIPLCAKSVAWGYGRIGLIVAGVIVFILGLPPNVRAKIPLAPVFCTLGMVAMWVVAWMSFKWTRATRARAEELAQLAEIPDEVLDEHLAQKRRPSPARSRDRVTSDSR